MTPVQRTKVIKKWLDVNQILNELAIRDVQERALSLFEQWADSCNLTLIHNAKLSKSFNSARWKRGYNTDLIFVSESIVNMCGKSVMNPIPQTQHRPICARANSVVMAHPTPFRRRFNLRKTDWDGYSTELDKLIEDVEPIPENYGGFKKVYSTRM